MLHIFIYILLIGMIGLCLGALVGLIFRDLQLQNGLKVVIKTFIRITEKKRRRLVTPGLDVIQMVRDLEFIDTPVEDKTDLVDSRALKAATELKQRLCDRFGNQIEAVYLFGSRVRGDYQPESDVDVAVFLAESVICTDFLRKQIIYLTGQIILKYGQYIQPRIFETINQKDSANTSANYLAQVVVKYGIPV